MLSSIILAWLAVLFTALTAVLYPVKRSGNKRLRKLFSRFHIGVGVLLIATGAAHGILAGNIPEATPGDMLVAPLLFTWNWGTACFIAAVLLAVSYRLRRLLRRRWMALHRVLTVVMIALVVLHISEVGIQLLGRIPSAAYADAQPSAAVPAGANAAFADAAPADGVYQGSAQGYKSLITVSVTVSGGLVTDIGVLDEAETAAYFRHATSVIEPMIETQSLAVDAVSGATYSSAGIVRAVADALSLATDGDVIAAPAFTDHGRRGGHGH